MAKKSADQIAAKYGRRLAASGQDYSEGVNSPSRDWQQATIQGEARWKAGLAIAQSEGRFTRGVTKAGTQKWQQNAAGKGAQRFVGAAQDAQAAYAQQASQVLAAADAARAAVAGMDNTTLESRIQRSAAANMATSRYWRGRGAGGG